LRRAILASWCSFRDSVHSPGLALRRLLPSAGSSSRPPFRSTQSTFSLPPVSNTFVNGNIRQQNASRNPPFRLDIA
jgi:hypothetical protein